MGIRAITWINKRLKVKILTLVYRIPHTLLSLTSFLVNPINPLSSRQAGPVIPQTGSHLRAFARDDSCAWNALPWKVLLHDFMAQPTPPRPTGTLPFPILRCFYPQNESLSAVTCLPVVSLNPNGMHILQRQGLCFVVCYLLLHQNCVWTKIGT